DLTALDVGARLMCVDGGGGIVRVEKAARRFGAELGIALELGAQLAPDAAHILAARMADCLFAAMDGGSPMAGGSTLLRLEPLSRPGAVEQLIFSGGVAEYIYGHTTQTYGDLGALLSQEILARAERRAPQLAPATAATRP